MAKPNSHDTSAEPRFWFQGISGYAWLVLIVAALGWLFDTFDQQLFTLIRNRSLEEILTGTVPAEELKATVQYLSLIHI